MGFGGIGPGSLILILVIVILLFGTKRLRGMGSDLGAALKNFKKSVKDGQADADADGKGESGEQLADNSEKSVIEGEATEKDKNKS